MNELMNEWMNIFSTNQYLTMWEENAWNSDTMMG